MKVLKKDVCKILNYLITENRIVDNEKVLDTFYYIRDEEGIIHSQNFHDVDEPFELLCSIEKSILTLKFQNVLRISSSYYQAK